MRAEPVILQLVGFGRVLREAGLQVGAGRLADAVRALGTVELTQQNVYWVLRLSLVSRHEDLATYDTAFLAWFLKSTPTADEHFGRTLTLSAGASGTEAGADASTRLAAASDAELLRVKDFEALTPDEWMLARRLLQANELPRPLRRSRRQRSDRKGALLDLRRTIKRSVTTEGYPLRRSFRTRVATPRKVVLLLDVSKSMESYARAWLLSLHAAVAAGNRVEAFAFGTRLTRLTPLLRTRRVDVAFTAASRAGLDWSGGTRIGESLKLYNDVYGRRGLTRGGIAVIVSDACEHGDVALVGRETARLARQAYAVVWVNPLSGHPEFEPAVKGMQAVLPHVDRLLPGNTVENIEIVLKTIGLIERRRAA